MAKLLSSLVFAFSLFASSALAGKGPIDPACSAGVDFVSYHIHVLFWQNSQPNVDGAMAVRDAFINAFDLGNDAHNCTIDAGDPAPNAAMCVFEVDWLPAGPFVTAQYSFFIPKEDLQKTQQWIAQNHAGYDVLIHPNSGCETYDHTIWAMWAGKEWEIDDSIFSCDYPMCGATYGFSSVQNFLA